MIKTRVIIIGANLKGVETELKHSGIRCTELISGISPLSMIGKRDEKMLELSKTIDSMSTHLDIKKNLAQMLSKDPNYFVQNYNSIPYGKNVDYFNPAEYIIVSNTGLAYEIFSNGEYVYTTNAENSFSRLIQNDDSYKKVDLSTDDFDWKVLYGHFVDTIMKEYDSKHIILIKTCASRFYLEDGEIKSFGSEYDKLGALIAEADSFFVEKTGCIEVNEAFNHIPTRFDPDFAVPFAKFDSECERDISRIIEDIIFNGLTRENRHGAFEDINSIVSLYVEYESGADKTDIIKRIISVFSSSDTLPVLKAKKIRERNVEFLTGYPYLSKEFKNFPDIGKIYIGLGDRVYIVFDPKAKSILSKITLPFCKEFDHNHVIENGYVCRVEEAEALCGSLKFYFERARRGEGQRPVRLVFESAEKFYATLNYIDYPELIENERFLIGTENDVIDTDTHNVKCDLGFFFDQNVKICILDNGLGDQITHYIFAKRLEDYTGSQIYYDDLVYYLDYIMNDREIDRIIKEDISGRTFSGIFTRRLLQNFKIGDVVPDKLAENGLPELTVIANNNEASGDPVKKCNKICLCSIQHDYIDKILACGLYPLYFNYYIRPEWLMTLRPFELSEYLSFPETAGKNKEIEYKMLNCDAVAIQMRRGDYVSLGWVSDTAFYAEVLEKLSHITDYPNKKFFVFSDDVPWIKEHSREMGLDNVDGEVVYVDHNKAEDSLFDMYLISLAKVVIGSASGFVKMGTLMSSRCEDFFCSNAKVKRIFDSIGKRNKHNISLSEQSIPNYSNTAEKRNIAREQNVS